MDPFHIRLLNKHRVVLVRDMRPDVIVDALLASEILIESHENDIMTKSSKDEKNRELLRILKERGKDAFGYFLEALKETNQLLLFNLLQKSSQSSGEQQSSLVSNNQQNLHLPSVQNHSKSSNEQPKGPVLDEHQKLQQSSEAVLKKLGSLTEKQIKQALIKSLVFICERMAIDEVLMHLMANNVITRVPADKIRREDIGYNQNRALAEYLQARSKEECMIFIQALIDTNQLNVAQKIADLSN